MVWGGEVYLDDLALVEGDQAGVGNNLIANGDFEAPLVDPWQVSTNCQGTLVTNIQHSGKASLRLVANRGGDGLDTALWQDAGTLVPGKTYTLSFWYYPGAYGNDVTVRTADNSLVCVRSIQPGKSATPGRPNSVTERAPALPPLYLNELELNNVTGIADQVGHRGPWAELHNRGTQVLSLDGFYLASNPAHLVQWAFPSGATIDPGQYRLIWLDGQPGETTAQEWHSNFRLENALGMVVLSQVNRGQTNIVDYLEFPALAPDQSYGFIANGGSDRQVFVSPTPGLANGTGTVLPPVFINEWMANNISVLTSPDNKKYSDWFELYNASSHEIDLSGYSLTDDPSYLALCILPVGTHIAAHGFLLLVADGNPAMVGADKLLHVSFKLAKEGDYIGLYAPNGALVDSVSFGPQAANVSQGRWPDGNNGEFLAMTNSTPGLANQKSVVPSMVKITNWVLQPGLSLTLTWTTDPGRTYQVQYKTELTEDRAWQNLGSPVQAQGPLTSTSDQTPVEQTKCFYRVLLVE